MEHPFIRYGQAIVCADNELHSIEVVEAKHLQYSLESNMESFRCYPIESWEHKEHIKYSFVNESVTENVSKLPERGIFLSPHIISTDGSAKTTLKYAKEVLESVKKGKGKTFDALNATTPMGGDYIKFTDTGGTAKSSAKLSTTSAAFAVISNITIHKPCLQYRIDKKPRPELFNVCLIPDIPLSDLIDFIRLFKRMLRSKTASDLMTGDVIKNIEGKGTNEKITYSPKRPLIYRGNFPNPPRSSALGSIALLGAIGEFAKEAEVSTLANKVLDSLKDATMYMIKYGGASTYTYNHHVVEFAKEGRLKEIIDSVYYTELYNEGRRKSSNPEYQKFDLFTSRFLQLFNNSSFSDFFAFRGEYSHSLTILFSTYFKKIEMIDANIVISAKLLGRWLNQVAYFSAKAEVKNGSPNYWEEIRKAKAKVLVELESSTFSAKSGDALIAQAVTRAGRLSGMDAPEGAALFMEKTASGDLQLDNAKNLLIAFSRLKNKVEQKEEPPQADDLSDNISNEESEDLSNE